MEEEAKRRSSKETRNTAGRTERRAFRFGCFWKLMTKYNISNEGVLHLSAAAAHTVLGVMDAVRAFPCHPFLAHNDQ